MIIDDFDLLCAVVPNEADAVLVIDADAVLAFAVTFECFEVIARRATQVVQFDRSIQHVELSTGNPGDSAKGFYIFAIKERLCGFALKALDHKRSIFRATLSVKRIARNG